MTAIAQIHDDYIDIRVPRKMFGKKPFSRRDRLAIVYNTKTIPVELDEFETRYTQRAQDAFAEAMQINEELKQGIRKGFVGTTEELLAHILEE